MPSIILRLTNGKEERFLEWSTVVDAPITRGMTRAAFEAFYLSEYGSHGAGLLPGRMARVDKTGSSAMFLSGSVGSLLSANRAGPKESQLSPAEIWRRYALTAQCTACQREFTDLEWDALERRGFVGHWRSHGKLYAIEMRQCPAPCNGTMGREVENPPMQGTEEVTEE